MADSKLTVEAIQVLLETLVKQLDDESDADGLEQLRDYLTGEFADDLDNKIEQYDEE